MRAVGISTLSARCRNIEKPSALQSALRTVAMASLKEGWRLQCHAADLGRRLARDFGIARPERNEGEQSERRRRRSREGEVRPLRLRFNTEMSAALLECCFDGTATDEPSENLKRRRSEIGAQTCLRIAHARTSRFGAVRIIAEAAIFWAGV
jgi:hypothetical protein